MLGLLHEKGKQYELANEKYINCIQICDLKALSKSTGNHISNYPNSNQFGTFSDLKGDAQLRMAIILKDTGKLDEAMNTCVGVAVEPYNVILRANALCLKVSFPVPCYNFIFTDIITFGLGTYS